MLQLCCFDFYTCLISYKDWATTLPIGIINKILNLEPNIDKSGANRFLKVDQKYLLL